MQSSQYINLVDENYKEHKTVIYYADRLNITPNYLNILSQEHLSVSASSIIKRRILLEAKRLLVLSDITIKEIAFELGFNDLAYFLNFFKEGVGISPTAFRANL